MIILRIMQFQIIENLKPTLRGNNLSRYQLPSFNRLCMGQGKLIDRPGVAGAFLQTPW